MNVRLLIDAIVRQTMVLIAQLATSGGLRAPLAHVAGQAFLELAKELEGQGVTKKVSADMFGMALRTYQRRTQRLSQSRTDRGRSLWEAVLDFIRESDVTTREQVLKRFRHDDEASLRGVLRDLTESGLVFASGSGRAAAYRLATTDELGRLHEGDGAAGMEAFVWSAVYRHGGATAAFLSATYGVGVGELEPVLVSLVASGRVQIVPGSMPPTYRAETLVLGLEDPAGWEASVLDHFSALVQTITRKLSVDQRAELADEIGGSTYHFDLWRGHPFEKEVVGELRRFRERMSALRDRLDAYNREHDGPERGQPGLRVDAYYGQAVIEEDEAAERHGDDE
jgi:hypothetical protein